MEISPLWTYSIDNVKTHRERILWCGGRDRSAQLHAKERQGKQRLPAATGSWKRWERSPLQVVEGAPVSTLSLNFWPSELWDSKVLLFEAIQFVTVCYGIPRKLRCFLSAEPGTQRLEHIFIFAEWMNLLLPNKLSWLRWEEAPANGW